MPVQRDVSESTITQLCWITRRAHDTCAKKLREAHLSPVRTDGKSTYYDPRDALPILFGVGSGLDPHAERAALDRAKREMVELELAEKRGELVPRADQLQAMLALATTVTARLDAVPAPCAHEVASESDPAACQTIIARHIREARQGLSDAGAKAAADSDQGRAGR